jgi:hypothetical protein
MTWIIIGVIVFIIGIFIYNGICTRCPNCGNWGLNTQTQENKEYEKQYKIENPEINDIQKQLFELMQSDPDTSRIAKDPENHFANRLLKMSP